MLPPQMAGKLSQALADRELLALRTEIGLCDVHAGDILAGMPDTPASAVWPRVRAAWEAFKAATPTDQAARAAAMDALIEQGTASKVAWDELHEVMQRRRKLCEAESRREIWLQTHITLEQAGALFEALRVSVAQNVRDPQAIRAIQDDLTRLLGTIH
ncbi:MAG: hypothetical protein IT182_02075 [Acidobacteria bacterium]|nr:hypothetical protein [Acidobacteriota bacterium]